MDVTRTLLELHLELELIERQILILERLDAQPSEAVLRAVPVSGWDGQAASASAGAPSVTKPQN